MKTLQGLPGTALANAHGNSAFVAHQGAQVLSWTTRDGKERLYLSAASGGMRSGDAVDVAAASIRGGTPISFPQFSGRGSLPKHGFVRNFPWSVVGAAQASTVTLHFEDQPHTRTIWPHAFHVESAITLEDDRLIVTLAVTNHDEAPWAFTAALHTYLRVDDVRSVELQGLHNVTFEDAADNGIMKVQHEENLRIGGEVDRVYLSPPARLLLSENGRPSLHIEQQGFTETVVWNPGPEKARTLHDMPDEDWLRMLCVEAACAAQPVMLQPGERWEGRQVLHAA
jgi:glucose-6-phosphate 1-epimerase